MAGFANVVMNAYHKYLSGVDSASVAQGNVNKIISRYNYDSLMARGDYQTAPWQGVKLRRTLLAVLDKYDHKKECGEVFFEFYAVQCKLF